MSQDNLIFDRNKKVYFETVFLQHVTCSMSHAACHIFACDLGFLLETHWDRLLVNENFHFMNAYVFVNSNVLVGADEEKQKTKIASKNEKCCNFSSMSMTLCHKNKSNSRIDKFGQKLQYVTFLLSFFQFA
jgi:hypothetical protein